MICAFVFIIVGMQRLYRKLQKCILKAFRLRSKKIVAQNQALSIIISNAAYIKSIFLGKEKIEAGTLFVEQVHLSLLLYLNFEQHYNTILYTISTKLGLGVIVE